MKFLQYTWESKPYHAGLKKKNAPLEKWIQPIVF